MTNIPDDVFNIQEKIRSSVGFKIREHSILSGILGWENAELALSVLANTTRRKWTSANILTNMPWHNTKNMSSGRMELAGMLPTPQLSFTFLYNYMPYWDKLKELEFVPIKILNEDANPQKNFARVSTIDPLDDQNENTKQILEITKDVIKNRYNISDLEIQQSTCPQYRIKDFLEITEWLLGCGYGKNGTLRYNIKTQQFIDDPYGLWLEGENKSAIKDTVLDNELKNFSEDIARLILIGGGVRIVVAILQCMYTLFLCDQEPAHGLSMTDAINRKMCTQHKKLIKRFIHLLTSVFSRLPIPIYPFKYLIASNFMQIRTEKYDNIRPDFITSLLDNIAKFDKAINFDITNAGEKLLPILSKEDIEPYFAGYSSIAFSRILSYPFKNHPKLHIVTNKLLLENPLEFKPIGPIMWRTLCQMFILRELGYLRIHPYSTIMGLDLQKCAKQNAVIIGGIKMKLSDDEYYVENTFAELMEKNKNIKTFIVEGKCKKSYNDGISDEIPDSNILRLLMREKTPGVTNYIKKIKKTAVCESIC